MKINLTSQEYRLLLDLIYLADWMMHAHEVDDSEETEAHDMLIQKLYSYATEAECADLVEANRSHNEYFPTATFEDATPARGFIEQYDDDTFWDELTERLTDRDLEDEQGKGATELSMEEYYRHTAPIRELYEEEFGTHGIGRLRIVES